jgi:exodeoxyribonuclease X
MSVIILDTETSGLTAKDQVIELAYMVLDNDMPKLIANSTFNQRYRPTAKIHAKAQEVHGIGFRDLLSCPSTTKIELPEITYMIGHNIAFDVRLLRQSNPNLAEQLDNIKYICTKQLVLRVEKQFKIPFLNHKLDTLIRHYYPDIVEELIPAKHEALSDCVKCFVLMKKIFELIPAIDTWDKLYNFQETLNKDVYAKK